MLGGVATASGFGAGLAPRAPGTAGTLAAVPLFLLLSPLPQGPYLLAVAGISLAGIAICGRAARQRARLDHHLHRFEGGQLRLVDEGLAVQLQCTGSAAQKGMPKA